MLSWAASICAIIRMVCGNNRKAQHFFNHIVGQMAKPINFNCLFR
jgi:hypothetical protein